MVPQARTHIRECPAFKALPTLLCDGVPPRGGDTTSQHHDVIIIRDISSR